MLMSLLSRLVFFFFFFNDTATTEIYTLSLHDALPIFAAEMRPSPCADRRDARRRAAPCGHPDHLIAGREMLARSGRPGAFDDHDTRAVGRPHRCVVERTVRGEPHRPAMAIGLDLVQRPALVGPRGIGEPLAVGRPRRHLLLDAVVGETTWRAVGKIHDV